MMLRALLLFLCLRPQTVHGDTNGVVKVFVQEDRDAILPCSPSTKENLEGKVFDWITHNGQRDVFLYQSGIIRIGAEKFKGRVSHFADELKNGNASILIRNAKIGDSGNYTCVFPHLEPAERFNVELVVEPFPKDRRHEQFQGASLKPYITILNVTEDGALLQCEVESASSKPEVEFQDSAGNVLPAEQPQVSLRERRYAVILVTTVTKSDHFRCVAKQKEIHHEISAETYVSVREKQFVDVTGWFGGYFLGVFSVIAVLALIVDTKHIRRRRIKGPCQQTERDPSGSDEPLKSPA